MDKFVVEGGTPLRGTVQVSGAKNSALPLLACALLGEGASRLTGVPDLADVRTLVGLLRKLGARADMDAGTAQVDPGGVSVFEAPYDLVKTMRASVLVLGPLAARFGKARISLPGGCAIGARPIDQHLKGLQALGAELVMEHGYVEARAKRLRGCDFTFDVQTVTGTENLLMAAALAEGTTILRNAACEPEIVQLAEVLAQMGAPVQGAGTQTIEIQGAKQLRAFTARVIADRIEAGTLLVAGALGKGPVRVEGASRADLGGVFEKLEEAGAVLSEEPGAITVRGQGGFKAVNIKTHPFPGFATDMQAQFMSLLACARGSSVITENVFENRFIHVPELVRLGARISVDGRTAVIEGVPKLSGAPVMATDLRASASLVLAGLVAEGVTEVLRIYHLDRGYERLERKLCALGARIRREKMEGV